MTDISMTPIERNALHALRFMREERDEARRECSRWMAEAEGGTPEEHAQEMGWDCFGVTKCQSPPAPTYKPTQEDTQ
jgi:hypothetical protein